MGPRLQTKQKITYGNCVMLSPTGEMITRISPKKANWYVERGLANITNHNNESILQLKFMPKRNKTDDPYYVAKKEEKCVICGSGDNLTRHHIVPHCYRRFFPIFLRSRSSYDIVLLCEQCHVDYEYKADVYKQELLNKYEIKIETSKDELKSRHVYATICDCRTLLKHGDKIPLHRQELLNSRINNTLEMNDCDTTGDIHSKMEMLIKLIDLITDKKGLRQTYKKLVNKIENFDDFIILWRNHFVGSMQPKFMPLHWDINRTIEQEMKRSLHFIIDEDLKGRYRKTS